VVVAGLFVSYVHRSGGDGEKQPLPSAPLPEEAITASDGAVAASDGHSIRTVYPGPQSGSAEQIRPSPLNETTAPSPPVVAATPTLVTPSDPLTANNASSELTAPQKQTNTAPSGESAEIAAAPPGNFPAPSGSGIDLNTASVEELNALGAGMIGRRIVENRPYVSPEDLVARRILKKADFEAIKAAVTVR